jgi:hypothetical protein
MSVIDPFNEFAKDLEVRMNEKAEKWEFKKDSLASNLDHFYEQRCHRESPNFPKKALEVLQDLNKKAHSSLDDLLKTVYDTQRSQDDESKRQIKDLVRNIDNHYQSQKSRNDRERRLTSQRLLVMEQSKSPTAASSPEQVPEETQQKHVAFALNHPGSAGKAFELAKATQRLERRRHALAQPRSTRLPRSKKAMRKERSLKHIADYPALSRKISSLKRTQNYGSPTGVAHRTSITPHWLPTACRLQKWHTASSLSQVCNASQLQRDEPDGVPKKIYAKPSLEQELGAAHGYVHPHIDDILLIDDALLLGQQLNEDYSNIVSLPDAKDSDGGDTEGEEMAEGGKEQQKQNEDNPLREAVVQTKENDEPNDKLETKTGGAEHQNPHHQEETHSLEQLDQSGPHGTMLSPEMGLRLWEGLMYNISRINSAMSRCKDLEMRFNGYKTQHNESSVNKLIDICVPATKGQYHEFELTIGFLKQILYHLFEVNPPLDAAQVAKAFDSMYGCSETSASMESSQCLSTAPCSGSGDSTLNNNDEGGDNLEVNACSEPKRPVFPCIKSAARSTPGNSPELIDWKPVIKQIRESPGRGLYLSPPSSAGTQYYRTSKASPRGGDSPRKWSSPQEENTPKKDSDVEKEVVSEDEKGNSPVRDMSSNGTGESSDIPEASREANTPAPGNSDGGDDPDPDPTKGVTTDNESSHPPSQSLTKDSGIFQWLKVEFAALLLLVGQFIANQAEAWVRVVEFVYQLLSYSYRRLVRRRNVDNDGKALIFPNLPRHEAVYFVLNHVFFLFTLGWWLEVGQERELWYIANGQTREHMLIYMTMQPRWISTAFSYYTSSLECLFGLPGVLLSWMLAVLTVIMQHLGSLWASLREVGSAI